MRIEYLIQTGLSSKEKIFYAKGMQSRYLLALVLKDGARLDH